MKTLNFTGYHNGLPCYGSRPSFLGRAIAFLRTARQGLTEIIKDLKVVAQDVQFAFS